MLINLLIKITVGVKLMFLYLFNFQGVKTCQTLAKISGGVELAFIVLRKLPHL